MGRHNVGVLLAIIAGLAAMAVAIWPIVPQAEVEAGPAWGLLAFGAGASFVIAAFIVDWNTVLSKIILVVGGLALAISGIIFGGLLGPERDLLAALIDLVPAALALIAAFLIGPIQKSRAEENRPHQSVPNPSRNEP